MFSNRLLLVCSFFFLTALTACGSGGSDAIDSPPFLFVPEPDNSIPIVKAESTYVTFVDEDVTYAEGLRHESSSTTAVATPLKLDVYYPSNGSTNRPVFMFIHGGGFTGGTKAKPEIVDMASYYASRGWVFISIDYRTAEALITRTSMPQDELLSYFKGLAPQEWIEHALQGVETIKQFEQAVAMYMAQRDAKAALRWIVANAGIYNINTDYITVGGASAGAITAITLGISNLEDFRDEISINNDPTLATTNIQEAYDVKNMVYFWGSNVKLDLFEGVYGAYLYDSDDPELFMAHGTNDANPSTPYSEAIELQGIYDSLSIHNVLVTLEGAGHGAWDVTVDGQNLSGITFDYIVERQNLTVE
ncbi:alpha/beta hydrolase [Pseudoalteromonas sp. PS5]|uniref:alpha/beta hydrolase n=1 Tax=Pseudoalteromonas sp. PS5 TaxID=1437473 RepID=UPI000FFF12D7|nr:alpha/beta hydrolase [Pseudoalteromonas sp. PS5]RXE95697.1 alpha/beta hydrolase [Pseudoalteromonas sp. PS5]